MIPKLMQLPPELLATMLWVMLTVPLVLAKLLVKRPPPPLGAELPETVLLLMLSVPLLERPPPLPPVEPWAMVRALSVKLTPLFTESTSTLLLPSRVTLWPLPSRVSFLLIPSVEPRVIVPLQPKVMVSPLAALLMALRRVASSQVLTVLV